MHSDDAAGRARVPNATYDGQAEQTWGPEALDSCQRDDASELEGLKGSHGLMCARYLWEEAAQAGQRLHGEAGAEGCACCRQLAGCQKTAWRGWTFLHRAAVSTDDPCRSASQEPHMQLHLPCLALLLAAQHLGRPGIWNEDTSGQPCQCISSHTLTAIADWQESWWACKSCQVHLSSAGRWHAAASGGPAGHPPPESRCCHAESPACPADSAPADLSYGDRASWGCAALGIRCAEPAHPEDEFDCWWYGKVRLLVSGMCRVLIV